MDINFWLQDRVLAVGNGGLRAISSWGSAPGAAPGSNFDVQKGNSAERLPKLLAVALDQDGVLASTQRLRTVNDVY
jgi:hypothetical protein